MKRPTDREVQKKLWVNAIEDIIEMVDGDVDHTYAWIEKVFHYDAVVEDDEDKEIIDEILDEYRLKHKKNNINLKIKNFSELKNQLLDDSVEYPYPVIHECYEEYDEYSFIIHGDFSGRYENCPSEMHIKLQRNEISKGMYRMGDYEGENWITISYEDAMDVSKLKDKLLEVYTAYYEWDED